MKYSKGVETAIFHILYLQLFLSFGMYLSSGLAWMTKSIQDFCEKTALGTLSWYMKDRLPKNIIEDTCYVTPLSVFVIEACSF